MPETKQVEITLYSNDNPPGFRLNAWVNKQIADYSSADQKLLALQILINGLEEVSKKLRAPVKAWKIEGEDR